MLIGKVKDKLKQNQHKLRHKGRLFKAEISLQNKESTYTARLISKVYLKVINQWNSTPNNRYTPFTVISEDCLPT